MAQNDENSPILIRGANGIPVGVVSPSCKDRGEVRHFPRSAPSSVLKATAVRKTATTKKKKRTETRDGRSKQRIEITAEEADAAWRPLGAAFLGGEATLSLQNQTPLLQPPRLSEEVQPVNLQGLFDDSSVNDLSKVHVYVRIRPEGVGRGGGSHDAPCLYAASSGRLAVTAPPGSSAHRSGDCQAGQVMAFNRVFGPQTSQVEYYLQTSKALVEQLVQRERYEGVFLSFGITAAGKTYTIQGTKESPGIIPLALQTLFGKLTHCRETLVELSYCEIYNEAIYDLLEGSQTGGAAGQDGRRPALRLMEAKDGSIMVEKLSWVRVEQAQEAWNVLRRGMKHRRRAETKLNYSSSRSHSVCSIRLVDTTRGKSRKLSFVDLAGSERAHRTGTATSTSARLKEAVAINGSLMTLGRCLEALRLNQKNKTTTQVIPYRESKVTHLFRDALHGYGNVVLSVNVSPARADFDETLRVLRYAMTASQIATTGAKPVKPSQLGGATGYGQGGKLQCRPIPSVAIEGSGAGAAAECVKKPARTAADGSSSLHSASPIKLRRLRKETPLGLKRHRQLMETVPRAETRGHDVSVSIDSRIHGSSPSPPFPQLLCEEEIDNEDMTGRSEIVHNQLESSSEEGEEGEEGEGGEDVDNTEDEEDGGVTMRGGKPVRSFATDALEGAAEHKETVERLKSKLRAAEDKLLQIEAEVRDEVATEMTQIIDTVEATYKQQIEDDAKKAESRMKALEMKHEKEILGFERAIESHLGELDELRSHVAELERRASKRRKKLAAAEDDAQRYKIALNDALSEIEKLHGIIEQEEEANAKLAASLSDILREQSLPDSPGTNCGDLGELDDLGGVDKVDGVDGVDGVDRTRQSKGLSGAAAKIRRIKREVTQIEANNAMEKDMSDHLIDRLKKDNDALRSKLAAMTHAIETCCTPSRNAVMQNLVSACPPGQGRGASGTPHDVALARARRLIDSPITREESPRTSAKSRFAKEAAADSPKLLGGKSRPASLREVDEGDDVHLLGSPGPESIEYETQVTPREVCEGPEPDGADGTMGAGADITKVEPLQAMEGANCQETLLRRSPRHSPRRSPRIERNNAGDGFQDTPEAKLPKTSTRVTRRPRGKNGKRGPESAKTSTLCGDHDDQVPPSTATKTRKLLAASKTPGSVRILSVSNSNTAKTKGRRNLGLPTAKELGFKT